LNIVVEITFNFLRWAWFCGFIVVDTHSYSCASSRKLYF